jgi:L-alanine-DL-glutamate epimerase-like enolase superfamily enzyme
MELHTQLLVCSTTALMVEWYDWFEAGFFTADFDVRGGRLRPSPRPGIGARISDDALREFRMG